MSFKDERNTVHLDALADVKRKIESGEYPLEPQPCFCGHDDDMEIKTIDRVGMPHRIVVCRHCAIARANPRMTQEAYASYYNSEYRRMTYRNIRKKAESHEEELELVRQHEYDFAGVLMSELNNEDIPYPKVVVDYGCYMGGMLDRFKEFGSETWGIEYNDAARASAQARGHKVYKTLGELIEQGVKADLVVMQDVVEHLLDLNDVHEIRHIMTDESYLYVYTPGLFRTDPKMYWQLAHTYYFVASTFNWVMNRMGFDATYIDEDISSFWQYTGNYKETEPPSDWVDYIADEAAGKEDRKLPPFRGVCKFTKKLLYDNMRANFAKKCPDIHAISNTFSGPVMILGGGPSVDGQVLEIQKLKAQGVPLIAIARMYPWCLERGIIPDYVVSLDCSEEQEKGFATISPSTTHLMATVTRPELIEKVLEAGAKVYVFDSRDDRKIKNLRREAGYEVATVINSGGTGVITCMSVAFNLGFNNLHVFGLDLCFANRDRLHAEGIAGKSVEQRILACTIGDEDLLTTPSFIEFARQALDLVGVAHNEGILEGVRFYGDSIINRLWDGKFVEEDMGEAA
jgi:hypothetical protein